jgi:diguanylate cyclase (GGDEF)-like protein
MRKPAPPLPPGQPDPVWLRRALIVERACLVLVFLLSAAAIAAGLVPQIRAYMPAFVTGTSILMAMTPTLYALSLMLTETGRSGTMLGIGRFVGLISVVIPVSVLVSYLFGPVAVPQVPGTMERVTTVIGTMSPRAAGAFLLLSMVMMVVQSGSSQIRAAGDVLIVGLFIFILVLVSQDMFGTLGLFGATTMNIFSPQALCYILLVTAVLVLRQAEFGIFSIFLGGGIGSRIARGFAPVLFLWPFLREIGESRLNLQQLIPARFAASGVTSLAVTFSMAFLLFIVWRINRMEAEIHELTLRDDLTGLYNMRGFYLLAEQTLRLAQRAQLPFTVLFLDLDGLKQINDQLGHHAGSAYLAETAELLLATFREGDVKGRFGGDEFVVAGQFSQVGIEIAVNRLELLAANRNANTKRRFPLSFSIGYVTSEHYSTETLKELVARADEVMYKEKRRKKAARA